jgi:predicted ATPase/DNA-binding SARP family transcriptional activator
LLALLVVEANQVLSTDRIIDELWGDQAPGGGVKTLRVHVSKLREVLEPNRPKRSPAKVLVTQGRGYALKVDPGQVDAAQFESLCREARAVVGRDPQRASELFSKALELWRGDPLFDFSDYWFARTERVRLNELRLAAMEDRISADIASGRAASAVAELEALIDQNPLRERLRALYMTTLYRTGRQTEALRSYQDLRTQLGEIGIEPSPEVRELEQRILDQDPALGSMLRWSGDGPGFGPSGSLPGEVDRFVGRGVELDRLTGLLSSVRLVTLVGAGGSGKTRLALEWARRRRSRTPVRFVDLAVVTEAPAVAEAVLDTLGLVQSSMTDPLSGAVRVLAQQQSLLIVDNCEHLIDAASEMIERLLADCVDLRVLATSREPLRVRGETVLEIPPLELPIGDEIGAIVASDAAQLFIDRAGAVVPDFEVNDGNAGAVAAILAHVDGIPLAIELAAVQLRSTPLPTLAESLGDAFAGHRVSRRTARTRHRTLTAALDWSYQLLEGSEQDLFRALGVLLTDFDEQAVQALRGSLVDLAGLVSKSMVTRVDDARYRLLFPVRQYAESLLQAAGEFTAAETARNQHFTELAGELTDGFWREAEQQWQGRFAADRVHLVAALDALHATDPERSAALVADGAGYWLNLGLYSEGQRLVERALLDTSDTTLQRRLHIRAGWMLSSGAYPEAEARIAAALDIAGQSENKAVTAEALHSLGSLLAERGHNRRGREKLQEAVALYEVNRPEEWFVPLANLALLEAFSGNVAEAVDIIDRLRRANESGELPATEAPYLDLVAGITARMSGDLVAADHLLARAADGYSKDRYAFNQSLALLERAIVRFEQGDTDAAQHLARTAGDPTASAAERAVLIGLHSRRLLARAALQQGDLVMARLHLEPAFREALTIEDAGGLAEIADTAADLATASGQTQTAADLLAWSNQQRNALQLHRDPYDTKHSTELMAKLPTPTLPADETNPLAEFLG